MTNLNFRRFPILFISFFIMVLMVWGCEEKKMPPSDTLTSGTIHISVDESFKPVIEEEINMFEQSYPDAHIVAEYKTEASCFKDLFNDSLNRLVIVTRGLTPEEDEYLREKTGNYPKWDYTSNDAITIIVNSKSTDTLFTLERLRKQLSGEIKRNEKIVFDGLNATSSVRFIMDSVLKGAKFDTTVVQAVKNSQEVIDYVAKTENAIGIVGISWVGNPEDSAQVSMLNKIKIAYVSCEVCDSTPYVKPMQASILTRRYPLVRGLYYVLKENYNGPGAGFVNFLNNERGQLIFKRAYLGTRMDFDIRKVKINQKL